jgi:hypothetical protein
MGILLVLMCYINHLSRYISYFHAGYWLMKRRLEAKPVVLPTPSFFRLSLERKVAFVCQVASWSPMPVLKDEVCG